MKLSPNTKKIDRKNETFDIINRIYSNLPKISSASINYINNNSASIADKDIKVCADIAKMIIKETNNSLKSKSKNIYDNCTELINNVINKQLLDDNTDLNFIISILYTAFINEVIREDACKYALCIRGLMSVKNKDAVFFETMKSYYFDKISIVNLSIVRNCDKRTIYRDIRRGVELIDEDIKKELIAKYSS